VGELPSLLRGIVNVLVESNKYFHIGMFFACGISKKYSILEFTLLRRN
jgi:hypothetical protein